MKKLLFIIILVPFITNAQIIKGIVTSKISNLPVEDANIYAVRTKIGTLTNEKGEFSLNKKIKLNDTLEISHVGYTTTKITITDLKKSNFIISLEEDIEPLKNVNITDNRWTKLKSKLDFTKLSSLEYGIYSFGSVAANGKIYVVGGDASDQWNILTTIKSKNIGGDPTRFNDPGFTNRYMQELGGDPAERIFFEGNLFIYDPKTDLWEKSNQNFKKRAYHNLNFYNNTLYVLGGKSTPLNKRREYLNNIIEVFDLNTNKLVFDKTNPHQAVNFASFVYHDNIIVMGGSIKSTESGIKTFTDKAHLYNLTSGLWYELAKMPVAQEVNGVLVGSKIFTIGNTNKKSFSEIQSFDLTNESWKHEAALLCRLENPAITYNEDIIYMFENGKLFVYDTKSKVIKEYLINLEIKSAAMHFINNKLYIIGGYDFTNYRTSPSSKTYSVSLDEFDNTRPNLIRVLTTNNLAKAD